ncbi:hypothetical protein D9756_007246 [Leucocoprinus leucothites]|uniref:Uncharacterized protein n=1 Tax=Leucocoprinus leucothites TaxID=201217 RepID=A0A8H5FYP9_9AGAR|nr:hypothetical protein D9756_007246 [Leucoagaricus leucothites]
MINHYDFTRLTSLSFTGLFMAPIVSILQNTPALVQLQIGILDGYSHFNSPFNTTLSLPHLRFLSLFVDRDNFRFLGTLKAPKLTVLAVGEGLRPTWPVGSMTNYFSALRDYLSTNPISLRALILEYNLSGPTLADLLEEPAVANLAVFEVIVSSYRGNPILYYERTWNFLFYYSDLAGDIIERILFRQDDLWPGTGFVGWAGRKEYAAFKSTPSTLFTGPVGSAAEIFNDRADRWRREILENQEPDADPKA